MDKRRSISFHLDEEVLPVSDLKDCINEFFGMVASASNDFSADITWLAGVRQGSVELAAYPESSSEAGSTIDQFMNNILHDFELLEGGQIPSHFSRTTLEHYNKLQKTASKGHAKEKHAIIEVAIPGKNTNTVSMVPVEVPEEITTTQNRSRRAFGTVYGEIKNLFGVNECYAVLYDAITDARIKVYFQNDLLEKIRGAFLNKVYVTGLISYGTNGLKQSIQAEDIELVKPNKKTQLADLFGILDDEK